MRLDTAELPTGERKKTKPINVDRERRTSHTSRPKARNRGITAIRGERSSDIKSAANAGRKTMDPAMTARTEIPTLSEIQMPAPAPSAPPPRFPALYQPLALPCFVGVKVVRIAPHADDNNIAITLPASRRIVSCVRDNEVAAIALAPHNAETPAAMITQVRRSIPVSTTGDHRKYQTFGIEEIAITFAMRSGEMPCLRKRKGMSTMMMPLNAPQGIERIPNSHGGL